MPTTAAQATNAMMALFARHGVTFETFTHRPIRTYEDADIARAESGFRGTEGKSLVLRFGDRYAVYTTLQGTRVDFKAPRRLLGGEKPRLATAEELREEFGAEPGNAYPFGFDPSVQVLVDPAVFEQEWILFSSPGSQTTLQVRGADLRPVYDDLPNQIEITAALNG